MGPSDEGIDDFELIRRMANQAANFEVARLAWGAFYIRHFETVRRTVEFQYARFLDHGMTEDWVQNGFLKAFDRAHRFDSEEICETGLQRMKVRAWVVRIIQNMIRDSLKGQPEIEFIDSGDLEELASASDDTPGSAPLKEGERLKLLQSGLATLSDTEREVLFATMAWRKPGEVHQRMPHSAMADLCKQLGKTPENVRKIRARALEKLVAHVTTGGGTDEKKE